MAVVLDYSLMKLSFREELSFEFPLLPFYVVGNLTRAYLKARKVPLVTSLSPLTNI